MPESVFLGLDVGTSGVKAILVAPSGEVVASATSPLTMATPHPGWAEQDPEAWWQAALRSIAAVKGKRADARIAAIAIETCLAPQVEATDFEREWHRRNLEVIVAQSTFALDAAIAARGGRA